MISFVEFSVAAVTRLFLGKVYASGFTSISSLILHLYTINGSNGSWVSPASRTFPLFLGVPASFHAGKHLVTLVFAKTLSKGAVTLEKWHAFVPSREALLQHTTNFCSHSSLDLKALLRLSKIFITSNFLFDTKCFFGSFHFFWNRNNTEEHSSSMVLVAREF